MITHPQNLRTGIPVWQDDTTPRIPTSTLTGDADTDILIVGAGISGAMIAQSLAGKGLRVMVVDRRKPVTGSTAASTALLQYEIDVPLTHLMKQIGRDKAIAAWRRSKLAVDSLACKIREYNLDCHYTRRETLYLAGNVLDSDALTAECAARNTIGLRCDMMSAGDLRTRFGVKAKAAIHSWDNLLVNPVQLASGFLKQAIAQGAQIFTPVTIGDVHHMHKGVVVTTDEGFTIRAKHVVFATGYEIPDFIHTRKHKITSTWAISTTPVAAKVARTLPIIWEAADPYLYLRTTFDGRIVCGGEDAEFSDAETRDALLPAKAKAIERKLRALLPDVDFTVDHSWAGSFGTSTTGLPSIGRVPGHRNISCAMAYGGNGITFSTIAAEILAALILGGQDPDVDLFAF